MREMLKQLQVQITNVVCRFVSRNRTFEVKFLSDVDAATRGKIDNMVLSAGGICVKQWTEINDMPRVVIGSDTSAIDFLAEMWCDCLERPSPSSSSALWKVE